MLVEYVCRAGQKASAGVATLYCGNKVCGDRGSMLPACGKLYNSVCSLHEHLSLIGRRLVEGGVYGVCRAGQTLEVGCCPAHLRSVGGPMEGLERCHIGCAHRALHRYAAHRDISVHERARSGQNEAAASLGEHVLPVNFRIVLPSAP